MQFQDATLVHGGTDAASPMYAEELIASAMDIIREPHATGFAARFLLQLERFASGVSRSVFFVPGEEAQLKPIAKRNGREGSPFHISKDLVVRAMRQGLTQMRQSDDPSCPNVFVIPAISGDRVVGVLHVEGRPTAEAVRWMTSLAALCAPR